MLHFVKRVPPPHSYRTFFTTSEKSNDIIESFKNVSSNTAKDIQDLFAEMRERRYNTTRLKIFLSLFGTLTIFVFYEAITDFISERATDVTSKSLEDPQFLKDATIFGSTVGKEIVRNLSKDPEVEEMFIQFFKKLFLSKPIKDAAGELSESVVHSIITSNDYEHEKLREDAVILAKEQICNIFNDPKIQQETSTFIWKTVGGAFSPFSQTSKKD